MSFSCCGPVILSFAHFQAVAVNIEAMIGLRHGTRRKTEDNKTGFGVDHGDQAEVRKSALMTALGGWLLGKGAELGAGL